MPLLNWPPSKGPKPPEMQVVRRVYALAREPRASRFKRSFSREDREERRDIVEAALEVRYRELGGKGQFTAKKFMDLEEPEAAQPPQRCDLGVDVSVEALLDVTVEQAIQLIHGTSGKGQVIRGLAPMDLRVDLTYPLSWGCRVKIPPYRIDLHMQDESVVRGAREMSVGYILWILAQQYGAIYQDWRRWGIYGHGLDALRFWGLKVRRGGSAEVEVVS